MKTGIAIKGKETFVLAQFKILKEDIFGIIFGKINQMIESSNRALSITLAIKV